MPAENILSTLASCHDTPAVVVKVVPINLTCPRRGMWGLCVKIVKNSHTPSLNCLDMFPVRKTSKYVSSTTLKITHTHNSLFWCVFVYKKPTINLCCLCRDKISPNEGLGSNLSLLGKVLVQRG